jgi:hypothetical protein
VKENMSSTRAVVDEAGDVVEAYDYYPFGLQSRSYKEKGDPLTKETFTGKEQDTESNLHYLSENELRVLVHKEFDIPLDSDLAESIRIDKNGNKTTIVTTDSSITIDEIEGVDIIIFENFLSDVKVGIKAVTFIKTADNKVVRIVEPRGIIPTQIDTLK